MRNIVKYDMYKRKIWQKLASEIETPESVVITGPRQVGKTTTLKWLLDQVASDNKVYLDLEQLQNRDIFEYRNYDNVLNELQNLGLNTDQKIYVALDEIQLVPNLPSVVKYLYDHYNFKFFLSGSSSYYLKNRFSESMAGRKLIFEMLPLSFSEFLEFQGIKPPTERSFDELLPITTPTFERFQSYYEEFVEFGGMPRVVLADGEIRKKQLLSEIFSSYIQLDVETLADFKSINQFRLLIRLLAARVGNKLDVSKLSLVTGLSRPTVQTYIEFLEQTYIIRTLPVFSKSKDVQTKIPKKLYFVDTGIANINGDLSGGAKFENAVCHQLRFFGELSFFADRHSEIDFIVDSKIGFETKETPVRTDETKLKLLSDELGLEDHYLVGKNFVPTFENYIYGALL